MKRQASPVRLNRVVRRIVELRVLLNLERHTQTLLAYLLRRPSDHANSSPVWRVPESNRTFGIW